MGPITFPERMVSPDPQSPLTNPEPVRWDEFYQGFTDKEKEKFLSTLMHQVAHTIQENLRKMRESLRKLRESHD